MSGVDTHLSVRQQSERLKGIMARIESYDVVVSDLYIYIYIRISIVLNYFSIICEFYTEDLYLVLLVLRVFFVSFVR